jgi:D-aminoacyl-tRNA deacylase
MRCVVQRVSSAQVTVDGLVTGKINQGLLLLLGYEQDDTYADIAWVSQKVLNMRIFSDAHQLMNLSVKDVAGEVLAISQFTLYASTKKGNRPSFILAAKPDKARELYIQNLSVLEQELGKAIQAGVFGADMKVTLLNDGPVTICLDSKNKE